MITIFLGVGFLCCAVAQKSGQTLVDSTEITTPAPPIISSTTNGTQTIILTEEKFVYDLYSPGFPTTDYSRNTDVYYEIKIDVPDEAHQRAARIVIMFDVFELQSSSYCSKDRLEIAESNFQIKQFCGSQTGELFLSRGSSLQMRFQTDNSSEGRGFSLRIELRKSLCAKTIVGGKQGKISSPGYPIEYKSNELCVWKIVAPANKRVKLEFDEIFGVQDAPPFCMYDFLQISKLGNFTQDSTSYCGSDLPAPIFSEDNVLLVKFITDSYLEYKGFTANYSFVNDEISQPTAAPAIDSNCACGKKNTLETRMVGGSESKPPHKYPWMAQLRINGMHSCGGSLISKRYILTAAHCLTEMGATNSSLTILLGEDRVVGIGLKPLAIDKLIYHRGFNMKNFDDDIALIRLKEPVTFGPNISPICLPPMNFVTVNRTGTVSGWGLDSQYGHPTTMLKETEFEVVPLALCKEEMGKLVVDSNVCIEGKTGTPCQGDSGGPAQTTLDGRAVLMGLTSFGYRTCALSTISVYTRVSSYLQWIEERTQDSLPCGFTQKKSLLKPNLENCGLAVTEVSSRIAGGYLAGSGKYPWMAVITSKSRFTAAGSLISPRYVITARHWFKYYDSSYLTTPKLLQIVLGAYEIHSKNQEENDNRHTYNIIKIIPHPKYDSKSLSHDLVIFKLEEEVNTAFVPICLLPANYDLLLDNFVYALGYGEIATNKYPKRMREVQLKIAPRIRCEYEYNITKFSICADGIGKAMCKYDAGDPLMVFKNGRYYLAGVSSSGTEGGCREGRPNAFAAVYRDLDWIGEVTDLDVTP